MNNINYREDQESIINYKEGTMAVPAVPGAGKTFIVTNLVAKLLKEKAHENKKILILTYMNSAVNNFKGRIKKILKDNDINEENSYEVMTIHSLAVKIIKEKPEVVMLNEDFSIADELQKSIILNECINSYRVNGGEKVFRFFVKEQKDETWQNRNLEAWESGFYDLVSGAISDLKYKEITSSDLSKHISDSYKGILRVVLPIYKQYSEKLKQNGLLDYDDILVLACKALSVDEDLRVKFQNRYRFVFEDECQDSNEIQGKIISIICDLNKNLVRVGDINQSITGTFSASDPKFFKEYIERADSCHRMDMSNRSSKDVIDLANRLVTYVTKEFHQNECRDALEDMQIRTVPTGKGYKENPNPEKYNINVKWYETWEKEIDESIRFTKGIKKKYPDKSIGILVPFNSHITEVANRLTEEGLEFDELGPNSLGKRRVILNISHIIYYLINCNDVNALSTVLDKVFIHTDNELGKKDFFELMRKYSVEDLIYDESIQDSIIIDNESDVYKGFKNGVETLKKILNHSLIRIDLLIDYIGECLGLEKEDKAVCNYLVFYIKFLMKENINLSLIDVYEILSDNRNRVFNHIIEVVYELNGYDPKPGQITVCNYHKSKGMEWDCVFLLGLTEYNFPGNIYQKFQGEKWYLKDKYKNPTAIVKVEIDKILGNATGTNYDFENKVNLINEKIRLLYVGITRAKEMLILSGSSYKTSQDVGVKKKEQNQCIYLRELGKYIQEKRKK